MEERIQMRKSVRKDGNRVGFGALLYIIITCGIMHSLTYLLSKLFPNGAIWAELAGIGSIIAVATGIVFLFLYFRNQKIHKQLFVKEKKMTPAILLGALCVMLLANKAGTIAGMLPEMGLRLFGRSSIGALNAVKSMSGMSISLFLYAGIIGPIAEELVYRGFLMRHLQKYGKMVALIGSAVAFGLMHSNLMQSIMAVALGLVLGYVALEYSVIWSIVLHILNNLVFSDLMNRALSCCSDTVRILITVAIGMGYVIAGIVILIRKGKSLTAWRRENAWQKPNMRWIITSVGALLFIACTLALTWRSIGAL